MAVAPGEHKQITTMFVDIVGSLERAEELGAEAWGSVLDSFFRLASEAVESLGGVVHQFTGDGLMAIFGAPLAVEDHGRRACLAALRLHTVLGSTSLSVRIGLHSGDAVVSTSRTGARGDLPVVTVVGHTVGVARRMEGLAPVDSTVLSGATAALVAAEFELADLGPVEVKGVRDAVRVFELLGARESADPLAVLTARGPLSDYVGRDVELRRLTLAFRNAMEGRSGVVLITGDPGVGKSRLVHEFLAGIGDRMDLYWARAVPHGRATSHVVLLDLMRRAFTVKAGEPADVVRDRIASLLTDLDPAFERDLPLLLGFLGTPLDGPDGVPSVGLDPEVRGRRLLAAVVRAVRAQSLVRPVVVLIEDVQWADEASAAFLDAFTDELGACPVLVLATARPEYLAATPQPNAPAGTQPAVRGLRGGELLELTPLADASGAALVAGLLGPHPTVQPLAAQIAQRAAGNPFFAEELVLSLVESRQLRGRRAAYVATDPAPSLLPPTVQASLTARIDHLDPADREVLRDIAVLERGATAELLTALRSRRATDPAPATPARAVAASLRALVATGLVEEQVLHAGDAATYAVAHPLIAEVAAATMVTDARRRLHAELAAALEDAAPGGPVEERAAVLAHHREAAGEDLAAATWYVQAAGWSGRTAPAEALRHWRAVRTIAGRLPDGRERDDLATLARLGVLAEGWRLNISSAEADTAYQEIAAAQAGVDEPNALMALADVAYCGHLVLGGRVGEGIVAARRNLDRAEALGDPGLLALVTTPYWYAALTLGDVAAAHRAAARAVEAAAGDTEVGKSLPGAADSPYAMCLFGRGYSAGFLGDLPAARRDLAEAIRLATTSGYGETVPFALAGRTFLATMVDDHAAAKTDADAAMAAAHHGGNTLALNVAFLAQTWAGLGSGDHDAATAGAEGLLAIGRSRGLGLELSCFAHGALGEVSRLQGDLDFALEHAERAVAAATAPTPIWGELLAQLWLARVRTDRAAHSGGAARERELWAVESAFQRVAAIRAQTGIRICDPAVERAHAAWRTVTGDEVAAQRHLRQAKSTIQELTLDQRSSQLSVR